MENLIGVITFSTFSMKTGHDSYEERVLLNETFDPKELLRIALTDESFKKFEILNVSNEVIYSSDVRCSLPVDNLLQFVKVTKNEEIISTTYDAYADIPYKQKTKVTWGLSNGGYQTTRKKAQETADFYNNRTLRKLEGIIKMNLTK